MTTTEPSTIRRYDRIRVPVVCRQYDMMDGLRDSILRFLLLPAQVYIILLLEFLNSFRSYGLRFVLYNYITNEFGILDTDAGYLLGVKGFVDILFGLAGSILVDIYGVRRVSLASLSVAMIGRTMLAFGRSKTALYMSLYFFSPCGDALLSVGLYRVALKKLTTPLTRPLGFAISYSCFNLAGALADVLIDIFRKGREDLTIESSNHGFALLGGVYTPVRQFIILTWMVLFVTLLIAYCYLEDLTVIDMHDLEDDDVAVIQREQGMMNVEMQVSEVSSLRADQSSNKIELVPAEPMIEPRLLRTWFPKQYQAIINLEENDVTHDNQGIVVAQQRRLPSYKIYKTQYNHQKLGGERITSLRIGITTFIEQVIFILRMRATWRVMVFGFATMTIAMNWTASELILPPFIERRYGEDTPIYTIQSINLFGCLFMPPLVGAFTSAREDFSVFMPGLWLMALSPLFIARSPNLTGACVWQVFMTMGEVFWSPRQGSWTASLAPTGSEGLFFAVSSARSIFGPLTDIFMGTLNGKYNSNCPECRDKYGHFCHQLSSSSNDGSSLQCASVQESCNVFLENNQQNCPRTCLECPTWEPPNPSTVWYILLFVGITSPLCIWFFLPFLRGTRKRDDECYGLLSCDRNRFAGIYGGLEVHRRDSYAQVVLTQHLEKESDLKRKISDVSIDGSDTFLGLERSISLPLTTSKRNQYNTDLEE